jgi:hypothetical protein
MSKATELLSCLLVAGKGVNAPERQAQARIKTRDYLNRDKKELKGAGVVELIAETRVEVQAKRAEAEAAGDAIMIEIYDAALSVFTTWTDAKDAA